MSTKTWQDKLDPNGLRFKNPEAAAWMEGFSDARMAVKTVTLETVFGCPDPGVEDESAFHIVMDAVYKALGIEEEG